MEDFSEKHRQRMFAARRSLHDALLPVANLIEAEVPSFEGFVLFQQDAYHEDSAGAIGQINASRVSQDRLAFQNANVTNRRVDLEVSTLGDTFQNGLYRLEESRMNPEHHLVAGVHISEQVGKRAASVFQLAFTREIGEPTKDDLAMIHSFWEKVAPECIGYLEVLHDNAEIYPNQSVADALRLNVPTTPNAFLVGWDTSNSRQQARDYYGRLRDDLTLRGHAFKKIVSAHGGKLVRPTGDGQMFALEIPANEYNRLSDDSIRLFAMKSLVPMVRAIRTAAERDGRPPIQITLGYGRLEKTTFDESSPVIFDMADISAWQPRDRTNIGIGAGVLRILDLDPGAAELLFAA